MNKLCKTCILGDKIKRVCGLSNVPIDPDKDFCSHHATSIEQMNKCEICGNPILITGELLAQDDEGNWHIYCRNCDRLLKTCQSCNKYQICAFETDPNPMPKVVVKTIQQGNAVMQAQVKNEERIKLFCHSCACWDEECGCLKEFNMGCEKKNNFWTSRKS